MKTICPYCKQEFLETPDEYLGVTLECPVCKKEFVCEKAKFCSECGAISPARAITCHKCGKTFPGIPSRQSAAPDEAQNYAPLRYSYSHFGTGVRISSADGLSFWDKVGINWCMCLGACLLFCSIAAVFALFHVEIHDAIGYILVICMLPAGAIGVYGAYLLSMVKDANKKIYWTPCRKIGLAAYCLICLVLGILICVVLIVEGKPKGILITLPMTLLGCGGAVNGWRLFNMRAEEDIDYEESEEDISAGRLETLLKIANPLCVAGLLPLLGVNFWLISLVLAIIYKVKGGLDYLKTFIILGIGLVIQVASFVWFVCFRN